MTVGPPLFCSENTDLLGSSRVCRRRTFLSSFGLRPTKCFLGDNFHMKTRNHTVCFAEICRWTFFSIGFFLRTKLNLGTWKRGVLGFFEICAPEPLKRISPVSDGLTLVTSTITPCSFQCPFYVCPKGHDTQPECLQLLVFQLRQAVYSTVQIVQGNFFQILYHPSGLVSYWSQFVFFSGDSCPYCGLIFNFVRSFGRWKQKCFSLLFWFCHSRLFILGTSLRYSARCRSPSAVMLRITLLTGLLNLDC